MNEQEIKDKLIKYAEAYIAGYTDSIKSHYQEIYWKVIQNNLELAFFPLYDRILGKDVSVKALFSENDFYMFFLEQKKVRVGKYINAINDENYSKQWTMDTPSDKRLVQVKKSLGIGEKPKLPILGKVNVPGASIITYPISHISSQGESHGRSKGQQDARQAEKELPRVQEWSKKTNKKLEFTERYYELKKSNISPQQRGHNFEVLWREVLDFYGWQTKKIQISGEQNDFTAIYQGIHVLGEVRWFKEAMSGAKMREFLGKLDARPQTIGLFISHSGVSEGGLDVVRRAINTKTVVIFGKSEIEQILEGRGHPGKVFQKGLRDVYDFVFEKHLKT